MADIYNIGLLAVSTQVLTENNDVAIWYKSLTKSVFQKSKSTGHISSLTNTKVLKPFLLLSPEYLTKNHKRLVKIKGKPCFTYHNAIVRHPLQKVNACIAANYSLHLSFTKYLYLLYRTLLI